MYGFTTGFNLVNGDPWRSNMRPHAVPKNVDLSLLEKVRLAYKARKMLGQLGLWVKSLAPLQDGAVPKRELGAVPKGHVGLGLGFGM